MYDDIPDDVYDELRAETLAARRRDRSHWCETCHGKTGPGSPCAEEPENEEPSDERRQQG